MTRATLSAASASRRRNIAVVARGPRENVDAILAHTRALAEALRAGGASVELVLRRADGAWSVEPAGRECMRLSGALRGYDLVVVQYNPFLWGRRGFAPWLPVELWRVRLRRRRPRIALLVHETYLQLRMPWRWAAMALWQRVQLRLLRPAADAVFVSLERWTRELESMRPKRPTRHLPVPSNLPDRRSERGAARSRLGVGAGDLVVATFSGGDPGRRHDLVAEAIGALAAVSRRPVLLALGTGGAPSPLPADVRVVQPGFLEADEVARLLAAADLFLAPFGDGVSTRRGSLMAALQHALPVVGTIGFLTDGLWASHPQAARLVPVDRPDFFAAATVELASDPELRRATGRAARALYEGHFDWPVVAARVLEETPR